MHACAAALGFATALDLRLLADGPEADGRAPCTLEIVTQGYSYTTETVDQPFPSSRRKAVYTECTHCAKFGHKILVTTRSQIWSHGLRHGLTIDLRSNYRSRFGTEVQYLYGL